MAGQRWGGKFSPGGSRNDSPVTGKPSAPLPPGFRNRRARSVSLRARLMYVLPLPLLFAAVGSILGAGTPALAMLGQVGGFAGLMLAAWLVNEGLRAEAAFNARTIARPPAIPRKIFAAGLSGLSVTAVFWLANGRSLFEALVFGGVAAAAHLAAFGLDPMKRKGVDGIDEFATERVAKAIDRAEGLVRDTAAAAARFGDRMLEGRVERLCDQARDVFRTIEEDPRDLSRARQFLSVYLLGLKDATVKFADLYGRSRDQQAKRDYEALLSDLETSFSTHRTRLLEDNRSDLDVEIEVLRERLQQDGLTTR